MRKRDLEVGKAYAGVAQTRHSWRPGMTDAVHVVEYPSSVRRQLAETPGAATKFTVTSLDVPPRHGEPCVEVSFRFSKRDHTMTVPCAALSCPWDEHTALADATRLAEKAKAARARRERDLIKAHLPTARVHGENTTVKTEDLCVFLAALETGSLGEPVAAHGEDTPDIADALDLG